MCIRDSLLQDLFLLGEHVGHQVAVIQNAQLLDRFRVDLAENLTDRFQTLCGLAQMA